ncbi:kinase domain protein [Ostertagia ostertagi]
MSTSGRLRLSDFKDLEEIGRGGFGIVYAATHPNGERIALKKICSRAAAERIKGEIRAIRCMRHPNIVQFFEDFIDGNDTYVVMELCELGSMRSYVKKNGPLSDRAAAYVLRQIISAVKYMHREDVLHRDLSTGNVLISRIFSPEKISVKLCDFGLATHLRKGETACTVQHFSSRYSQVFKQEYDQAADVYSLGGVLYTMLTASDPPSKGITIHINYALRFPFLLFNLIYCTVGPLRFDGLGISAVELIERMMEPDAGKRISLNDIQQSTFMIDYCDVASISRDWSAMGDRGTSVRSRERRHSREYSKERRTAHGDEPRPRRTASNPPIACGRTKPITGGGDSGIDTRSGGEYVIVDDNLLIFEVANKSGFIAKIVTVSIDGRGKQQVTFGKPLHSEVKRPLENDSLIAVDRRHESMPLTSYSSMSRHERDLYAQIANAVEAMRGRVDKVVYQRPSQFPNAVAKIMENGAFRIVFRDQRRLVQKSGSREVQLHFPDGRKEDVSDTDMLDRFNDVRKFLQDVERVWERQIGLFPLSFSISRDTATSPRIAHSEVRVPLAVMNSQAQSLLTQRSAPATVGPRGKISLESTKGLCAGMRFKINKNNEVCSVESPDGRYLRVSSVSKSRFIYRSQPGSSEQRFHVGDDVYPKGARELYESLQLEIKRREALS